MPMSDIRMLPCNYRGEGRLMVVHEVEVCHDDLREVELEAVPDGPGA